MQVFIPKENARGFIMPNFIFDNNELSCGAKLLFSILCDYARDKSYCYPSKQTLADRLNVSINTIKTWLKQLISFGYVQLQQAGKRLFFHLFSPAKIKSKIDNKLSKTDDEPSKFDTEINVKNLNNLNLTPPISPESPQLDAVPEIDEGKCENFSFEDFWEAYPRKENKEKARKAYEKNFHTKKIPTISIFQGAVEFFKNTAQWQKECGRFIPQLHNFFNDLRWEDVPQNAVEKKEARAVVDIKNYVFEDFEQKRKQEEEEEKRHKAEVELIKESFDDFKNYFSPPHPRESSIAYGLYMSLFRKGLIPKVSVLQSMNIVDYLIWFRNSEIGGIADEKEADKNRICKS